MKSISLGEVCHVTMGQAPPGTSYNNKGDGLPLVAGAGDFGGETPMPKKFTTAARKTSIKGDIILCIRATIGDLNWSDKEYCLGRGVAGLRPKNGKLDSLYLWYVIPAVKNELLKLARGSTFKQVSSKTINNLKIPLPPLAEQRRIAAILDKADGIRRKKQEILRLTDELLKSTFLEMFGDPVTNPKGWAVKTFAHCIKEIKAGWSSKGENRTRREGEWGVLKISAVTTGKFKREECKVVPTEELRDNLVIPKKGDLLFSRANTRELVAASCLVEEDEDSVFLPDKLWRIKPMPKHSTVEYLHYLIQHDAIQERISRRATGTSGSMLNVSQKKLLAVDVPVPPINLQRKFTDCVWKHICQRQLQKKSAKRINILFNSLIQKAFRGELSSPAAAKEQLKLFEEKANA